MATSALRFLWDSLSSALLRERAPLTLRLVGIGLLLSWAAAMALALSAAWLRVQAYDALTTVISGAFLCIPAAVLALLSVLWNVPGSLAVGLIVFPRVYRYSRNLLAKAYSLPHIVTARAKGLSELRILFWHVVPVAGPQLLAVAGVSVSIAVGAAIPVEALCGLAGVGQLAWQAALARDLPLLMNITILVTLVTLLANSGADVIGICCEARKHEAVAHQCLAQGGVCGFAARGRRVAGGELAGSGGICKAVSRGGRRGAIARSIGWAPMRLAATASPVSCTERGFRCCSRRRRLCFRL